MAMTPLRPPTPSPASATIVPSWPRARARPSTSSQATAPAANKLRKSRGRSKSASLADASQSLARRISYPILLGAERGGGGERDDRLWGIRSDTPLSFPASVTPTPAGAPRRVGAAVFELFESDDDEGVTGEGGEEDLWASARYAEPYPRPRWDDGGEEADPFRASPISTHFSVSSPVPSSMGMSAAMSSAVEERVLRSPRPLRRSGPSLPTIVSTYSEATTELSSRHGRISSRFSAFSHNDDDDDDDDDDHTTEAGHAPPEYHLRSTYTPLDPRHYSEDNTRPSSTPTPSLAIDVALPTDTYYAPVTFIPRSGPRPRSQTWAAPPPVLDIDLSTDSPTLPSFEWARLTRASVCSAFEAAGGQHWSPPPSPAPSPTLEAAADGECSTRPVSGASATEWIPFPRSRPASGAGSRMAQAGLGVMSPPSSPGWLSQRAAGRPRPARVAGQLGREQWMLAPAPAGTRDRRGRPITAIEEEANSDWTRLARNLRQAAPSPTSTHRYSSPSSMVLFDKLARRVMDSPAVGDHPNPTEQHVLFQAALPPDEPWQGHDTQPFGLPSGVVCPVPTMGGLAFPSQSDVQDFVTAMSGLSPRASLASGSSHSSTEAAEEAAEFDTLWRRGQGSPETTVTSWGSRDSWVLFKAHGRRSV